MESADTAHVFAAELIGRKQRQAPPQLNLNLNLSLQLPAGVDAAQLPAEVQQQMQELLKTVQQQAPALVEQALRTQSTVTGYNGSIIGGAWRRTGGH